eukprot:CAMPEP_0168211258 /NCGR_PEP_ID=MMETSP0140_2-20121125/3615_1 /TAXON_ID=44445 /ORGANISM="Pseudo-nitzschia australis, Strain 10249 10 AB" /LENGTH=668 /DNA_ID=CAMNT_0008137929 /DNA_START=260 /DNA_END=2266 /DNA_ORIENTATION=+
MKFTLSAVLALASMAATSDAFLSPTLKMKTTAIYMAGDEEEVNEDGDQGTSRFREMMAAAKQRAPEQAPRAMNNPFLNPPPSTLPPPTQSPMNPDELSVEEQARMFREMMAGQAQAPAPPPQALPVRTSREDTAGRPVGRNPDADKIGNTSDLYFAQLKRDSSVRTMARIREDDDVSEAVFQDGGIEELDNLFQKNPYLKSQQDEEKEMLQNLPSEVVAPYFNTDKIDEEELSKGGISYKKKLMERRQKNLGGGSGPAPAPAPAPVEEPVPEPVVAQVSTPPPPPPKPEPVVAQVSTPPPPPSKPEPVPQPEVPAAEQTPFTVTSSTDGRKQNIRTMMGLTLKHRGGPAFGKGRLKGPDIDLFEGLVGELTNMLRDEAALQIDTLVDAAVEVSSTPVADPVPVPAPAAVSVPVQAPAAVPAPETPIAASAEPANIENTIACIEGAITMYKNSPPAIRDSVLVTLRAALMSAVDTCNAALASQPAPPITASADASIEGMVACIEGAVTMYKNSPPVLKESILATLRMALMSAVETCNVILSPGQVAPPAPAPVAPAPVAPQAPPPSTQAPPPPSNVGTDRNSKALENIFEKVEAAAGDGKFGLRSDLTAAEATELADQLVDMRGILMQELESDIPGPKPAEESSQASGGTSSKYEQMLAKARAEKAKLS